MRRALRAVVLPDLSTLHGIPLTSHNFVRKKKEMLYSDGIPFHSSVQSGS
jgi:hypothetical protein